MMDRFIIEGGSPLVGRLDCPGSKNAALPMMAAALLADGVTHIENVPDLHDIRTMAMVLRYLGADVRLEAGTLTIDTAGCRSWEAPYELVRRMRASFYVMGPLLARFGRARVSLPGGCALGPRPVDIHLRGFERLGCRIELQQGYVIGEVERLRAAEFELPIASVGATANLMMAATAAEGETVILNAACEPDISDLAGFLGAMGADIQGAGTSVVKIVGGKPLHPIEYRVMPDRIVAGTLLIGAAITGGDVTLDSCRPDHIGALLKALRQAGMAVEDSPRSVRVDARGRKPQAVSIIAEVYPGFPTDLQPPWTALMSLAEGRCTLIDTIYPARITHVPELNRLGADIDADESGVHISGARSLRGASVMCSDIRGGAALALAALAAEGHSEILRVYHIDRGYEKLERMFGALSGRISRVRE